MNSFPKMQSLTQKLSTFLVSLVFLFVFTLTFGVSQANATAVGDLCKAGVAAKGSYTCNDSCTCQCGEKDPLTVTAISCPPSQQNCPWGTNANGSCNCPTSQDACSSIGSYQCIRDPYLSQCVSLTSAFPGMSCPQPGYWKAQCFWPNTQEGTNACIAAEAAQSCNPPNQPPSTPGDGGSGGGGGGNPTPPPLAACGEKCTTNDDCRNPSTAGVPVACRKGICENTACPTGMTTPGANCSCKVNTRVCGDTCGAAQGLCDATTSECGYVGGPTCSKAGGQTYCLPNRPVPNPYYDKKQCTVDAASYLVTANGSKTSGFTQREVREACAICGNGVVNTGEECDEGSMNGNPNSSCDTFCKKKSNVACNQKCSYDRQCNQHVVKLVNKPNSATQNSFDFDAVNEFGTNVQSSNARFFYTSTWNTISNSTFLGGSLLRSTAPGASVSFTTSADLVTVLTRRFTQGGSVEVYVDGVLKQTVDLSLASGTGQLTEIAIPIYSIVQSGPQDVSFINRAVTSTLGTPRSNMRMDYLKEGTVTLQENNARIKRAGTWNYNGGTPTYLNSTTDGSSLTLSQTSSRYLIPRFWYGPNSGKVEIKIGNTTLSTVDLYATTGEWRELPLPLNLEANKYICANERGGSVCRLSANPTSTTCGVTPTPTPPGQLTCDLKASWTSTGDENVWKFGDSITFSTTQVASSLIPSGGSARYEGKLTVYRAGATLKEVNLVPINATASQFQPYKIAEAGTSYSFIFRYCIVESGKADRCSNWGQTPPVPQP